MDTALALTPLPPSVFVTQLLANFVYKALSLRQMVATPTLLVDLARYVCSRDLTIAQVGQSGCLGGRVGGEDGPACAAGPSALLPASLAGRVRRPSTARPRAGPAYPQWAFLMLKPER